jgi:biopolymer transport protein ExbB/TolQ
LRREGVTDDEIREWRTGETGYRLRDSELSAIRGKAERLLAEQQLHVESRFSHIATVSTAAPLLGLFGTVWGVMVAFMMMAGSGSAMLSAVAPGISGALLTTVTGLLVALPSTIGYNILVDRARAMTVELENFVDEYMADVIRIHGAYSDH